MTYRDADQLRFSGMLALLFGQPQPHALGRDGSVLQLACDFANEPVADRLKRLNTPSHALISYPLAMQEQWRAELTDLLQAAIEARPQLLKPSAQELDQYGARLNKGAPLWWRPEQSAKGIVLRRDAYVEGYDGIYALAATLLMDASYRSRIKRCPNCGAFFVRVGKRIFHRSECYDEGTSSQRKRNERLRNRAVALLPAGASSVDAVKQALRSHPNTKTPEQLAERARAFLKAPRRHK